MCELLLAGTIAMPKRFPPEFKRPKELSRRRRGAPTVRVMRMAISIGGSTIDEVVTNAKAAEQAGFHSAWLANIFGLDAMTAIAVAGREVPRIELGTAVVP